MHSVDLRGWTKSTLLFKCPNHLLDTMNIEVGAMIMLSRLLKSSGFSSLKATSLMAPIMFHVALFSLK